MPSPTLLDPPLVTVLFKGGQGPHFNAHATTEMAALTSIDWAGFVALFPGTQVLPLLSCSVDELQNLKARAQLLSPNYVPARFEQMFRLMLPPTSAWQPGTPQDALNPLRAMKLLHLIDQFLPIVEHTTVQLVAARLAVSDPPSGLVAGQEMLHLADAPQGIGVDGVWSLTGGTGGGETITDVERGWFEAHREFSFGGLTSTPITTVQLPGNVLSADIEQIRHGTAALAVAVGRLNQERGVGVAPGATEALLASAFVAPDVDNIPDAITRALTALITRPPGSVMMLEMEISAEPFVKGTVAGTYTDVFGPCEMDPFVRDVIQLAVACHVIVVEAAGNGNRVDKQLSLYQHGEVISGDSGAILVGASSWTPPAGSDPGFHQALPPFTIGNRINCFAWGQSVYSAWVLPGLDMLGNPILKDFYNAGFGGTSAATAIVAGAALVVQGLMRAQHATYLPPLQMRSLLGDRDPAAGNTALRVPATADTPETFITDTIGVMPNLTAIAGVLGLLPDLYIRDNESDDGGLHDGVLCKSPDIILVDGALAPDTTPTAEFGEGTEDEPDKNEVPVRGGQAEIYVRVRNRGGAAGNGAKVKVFWSEASTLMHPGVWLHQMIDEVTVDVPADGTIAVAGPIKWPVVPDVPHFCLIASVEHDDDPHFTPEDFPEWSYFTAYIRAGNNVAWRNYNPVPMPASEAIAPFSAAVGAPDEGDDAGDGDPHDGREMEFRVEARLPDGARLVVELPADFAKRLRRTKSKLRFRSAQDGMTRRCTLKLEGVTKLGLVKMPPGERQRVLLHVKVPAAQRTKPYEIALIQLHEGLQIGRVTWRLVPPGGK